MSFDIKNSKENNFKQEFGNQRDNDECDLIELVNKLQNKLAANGQMLDISLPQIVVIGSQSAGKSSVLESLIGREFLPRGERTVTRRPTVVQLQPSDEVCGVFLHLKDTKFTCFEAIKQEIRNETNRDPGLTGFSSKPINLTIYLPNVLKLSFVDMPGLFKNVAENQPEEDIEYVNNMTMNYIEKEHSLILAVTLAGQDIMTSDALGIAKKVDSKRERTIGVLTKLDLIGEDKSACDVLENKTVPLKRGYVGVRNRNQQEINEGRDITYSLEKEKEFFENHPDYRHMAHVMGSPYLYRLLHEQLREHIRDTLPKVCEKLKQNLNSARSKLKEFDTIKNFTNENSNAVQAYFFKLVQHFIDDIHTKLFGNSSKVSMDKLEVGAVINYKIYTDLQKILEMPTNLKDEEMIILINNEHGIRNTLSITSATLEAACSKILKPYIDPLQRFADSITELLKAGVEESAKLMSSYPNLQSVLVRLINEAIDKATMETKELLDKHIKAEMMYCNIYHWDFTNSKFEKGLLCKPVKVWKSFQEKTNNPESGEDSSTSADYISDRLKENANAKENAKTLAHVIKEYIQLIQKQIGDVTLKYIMCFLVKDVSEYIKNSLILKLMTSDELKKSLMKECEKDFAIRQNMLATCEDLEEALDFVQSF